MKKATFGLNLFLITLGISMLISPKVTASTLDEQSELTDTSTDQTSDSKQATTEKKMPDKNESAVSEAPKDKDISDITGSPIEETISEIADSSKKNTEADDLSTEAFNFTREARTTVNSENDLENALSNGVRNITIGKDFDVTSQISYNQNFTIDGGGHTLTFSRTGGFFSGAASGGTFSFNNLTVVSSVTNINSGATTFFSSGGNATVNFENFNYTTTTGCPLVSTENVSDVINLNFNGTNNLTTSVSWNSAPETTLLKDIGNISVLSGKTSITDSTPNQEGEYLGSSSFSAIKLTGGSWHTVTVSGESSFDINSSKNILFDLNGTLGMSVGSNSTFNYNSQNNNQNQVVGSSGASSSSGSFTINAGQSSKLLFQTDGPGASFNGMNVQINANSPEYVQFNSTANTPAVSTSANITFSNTGDNTGISGIYILAETPVNSSQVNTIEIPVGSRHAMTKNRSLQNVTYHKTSPPLVKVGIEGVASIGANTSTISSQLTGSYNQYTTVALLASPKELTDSEISNAITNAQNDDTGKSGYYQSVPIPTDGKISDITNVWAGTYYLYARLSNSSNNQTTDWIETTVEVAPHMAVSGTDSIDFAGGYDLILLKSATLVSVGNTDMALTLSTLVENNGSSNNVTLVETPQANQKELRLNLQGKNANSSALWSPLLLNATPSNANVILSPYWTEAAKSQATFEVNGRYSGPLGINQIEKVSYKVTMKLTKNN